MTFSSAMTLTFFWILFLSAILIFFSFKLTVPKLEVMGQDLVDDDFNESGMNEDVPLRNTNNEEVKSNKCNQCNFASSNTGHLKMLSGEKPVAPHHALQCGVWSCPPWGNMKWGDASQSLHHTRPHTHTLQHGYCLAGKLHSFYFSTLHCILNTHHTRPHTHTHTQQTFVNFLIPFFSSILPLIPSITHITYSLANSLEDFTLTLLLWELSSLQIATCMFPNCKMYFP